MEKSEEKIVLKLDETRQSMYGYSVLMPDPAYDSVQTIVAQTHDLKIARLLKASPELLEACKEARDLLIGVAEEQERQGLHNAAINVRQTEIRLVAAINLAEKGQI